MGADAVLILTEWQHTVIWIGRLWLLGCVVRPGCSMPEQWLIPLRSKPLYQPLARWRRRKLMARTVLVTGAAGFIGAALSQRLLQEGDRVVGIDNLNNYYDPCSSKRGCV